MNPKSKALSIAKFAQEKKAEDIVILDMAKVSDITDFFLVCSGSSTRQVKAIADHILENLDKNRQKVWHIEGYIDGLWVLLDCGDVIVHVFHAETRQFYELEKLWSDASIIRIAQEV